MTFRLGTDVDLAQVKVQNRVQTALPPSLVEVQNLGVSVRKGAGDTLLIVHVTATDAQMDRKFLANYASLQIRERLLRVPGVGDVGVNAARDWRDAHLDRPGQGGGPQSHRPGRSSKPFAANNVQVAAGAVGAHHHSRITPLRRSSSFQTAAELDHRG